MHQVEGTRIVVNVGLNAGHLRIVWICAESMVEPSWQPAQEEENNAFDDWPEQDKDHRSNHGVSGDFEPSLIEICTNSINEAEMEELLGQIGIDEEQEEDRIEELQVECQLCCFVQLLSFSGVSNPVDQ